MHFMRHLHFQAKSNLMTCLSRLSLLLLLLSSPITMSAQVNCNNLDTVYGKDPLLYNGKKYSYFPSSSISGSQFFTSKAYVKGDIMIRDKRYTDLDLNYDILNQKLLLKWADEKGATQVIEISEARLEGFSLGNLDFAFLNSGNKKQIYQVLGEGPYYILYYWKKKLNLDNTVGAAGYTFSEPIRSQYLMIGDQVIPFGSQASFIKKFDPSKRNSIKEYIHRNSIKVMRSTDGVITGLLNYINDL